MHYDMRRSNKKWLFFMFYSFSLCFMYPLNAFCIFMWYLNYWKCLRLCATSSIFFIWLLCLFLLFIFHKMKHNRTFCLRYNFLFSDEMSSLFQMLIAFHMQKCNFYRCTFHDKKMIEKNFRQKTAVNAIEKKKIYFFLCHSYSRLKSSHFCYKSEFRNENPTITYED